MRTQWSVVPVLVISGLFAGCSSPTHLVAGPPRPLPPTATTKTPSEGTATTATTTSAPPSVLPAAPPCDTQPAGGSGIRPTMIFFGCATSNDFLGSISWSSWTAAAATAPPHTTSMTANQTAPAERTQVPGRGRAQRPRLPRRSVRLSNDHHIAYNRSRHNRVLDGDWRSTVHGVGPRHDRARRASACCNTA